MKWNKPDKAPKDGTVILGRFESYPFPTICSWNGVSDQWVIAELQVGMYKGKYNDTYFESELYKEEDLIEWVEL